MGAGFAELSDEVWAYEGGRWLPKTRWKPLSTYSAVAFNYLRNEASYMTTTEYRRAYDKIVAQATKNVPRTIAGACMPASNGTQFTGTTTDPARNHYAQLAGIAERWGIPFADFWSIFPARQADGTYAHSQLMRDMVHPTAYPGAAGVAVMADTLYPFLRQAVTPKVATPEISGRVITYLWGEPSAGSWSLAEGEQRGNTFPGEGWLWRVARSRDLFLLAPNAPGARLGFPAKQFTMLYVHTIGDVGGSGRGGTFDVIIDRGTGSELRKSLTMVDAGVYYPHSYFVADGLAAAVHTVEIETTNTGPVRIQGVTFIGVP